MAVAYSAIDAYSSIDELMLREWKRYVPALRLLGLYDPFKTLLAQMEPRPVRVPPLRIPDFRLEPLHPERGFGLDVPAGTGGSFPFGPSPGWGASQLRTWGPAQNLYPMSLQAERRQRRDDELERAYETFLKFVSPGEILPVQE